MSLHLHSITFSFDAHHNPFFIHLSADFSRGTINFIQGSNGVGKSTLFRILSGNITGQEQLSGTISYENHVISCSATALYRTTIQKIIKVVQQQIGSMLADQFTVEQNLQAALFEQYPTYQKRPTALQYVDMLASFNIDLNKKVCLLSGGQKQILAILMVLQKSAPVLLLDEPTAALDPKNTALVIEFLQELTTRTNITVLIINHDKEVIEQYAPQGYYELFLDTDGMRSLRKKI